MDRHVVSFPSVSFLFMGVMEMFYSFPLSTVVFSGGYGEKETL